MKHFVIYGLIGWIFEIIWTGLWSLFTGDARLTAKTYLWMFPIYGLLIMFEPLHEVIRYKTFWVRGAIWMVVFFALEYVTGWLLQNLIGTVPWDYTGSSFSIHGLIRLDYAPVWFIAGLLFEKFHDWLEHSRLFR